MLLQRLEVSETDGLTALSKVGQLPAQFVLLQLHTLLPSHHITSHFRHITQPCNSVSCTHMFSTFLHLWLQDYGGEVRTVVAAAVDIISLQKQLN